MRILRRTSLFTLSLLLAALSAAKANLATDYVFISGSGSPMDMTGSTTIVNNGDDDVWSSVQSLGFTFYLDGQPQTYFIAESNGPIQLGNSTSISYPSIYAYYSFNSTGCPHPVVTAFYDDLVASDNAVRTKLFGTAPNRIRVVDWEAYLWYGQGTTTEYHFQVRLYEGSNKIELWYGQMGSSDVTNGNGQIGAALTTDNYISIAAGTPAAASGDIVINDLSRAPISNNTLYTLRPCQKNFTIAGNPAQGGTPTMDSGTVLLSNYRTKVGTPLMLQPYTITMGEFPCGLTTYNYQLTGAAAGDYSITPSTGTIGSLQTNTPTLTFTPTDTGVRVATLRITDGKGFNRAYTLQAGGFRCIDWAGDLAEGGTSKLLDGDILLEGKQVPIGTSQSYTPIRINQLASLKGCTDPVPVTYTLDDPTGNYSISPTSEIIPVGGTAVPVITFNANNGVGIQEAILTVIADGERRSFLLRDFISAPGGEIRFAGTKIGPGTTLFRNEYSCVGEAVLSLELQAVNIGTGDFVVRDITGYSYDTTLRQGVPPYPLLRDAFGQLVKMQDYFLSASPGVAPRTPGDQFDSLVVPEGQTKTFYLNIITTRPGKRYAKIFFPTNAFNLHFPNVNGDSTQGMTSADVFGTGSGSLLSGKPDGSRPHPVNFAVTKVRESQTLTTSLYNEGNCDLRIDEERLRFESGDIHEFELLSITGATLSGGFYTLAPGQKMDVTVRFTPGRSGVRVATMRLATNDSSLIIPQITRRGVFYWEFTGTGKLDLEARDVTLPPAVIGAETSSGIVKVENTKLEPIGIDSIRIVGGGGEIIMDPNHVWPTTPVKIGPGENFDLGVTLLPDPNGTPGVRTAEIQIFLSNGDTARATISGYAGTRLLTVAPATLFQNMRIPVGDLARGIFTVTNTSTLQVVLTQIQVTGTDKAYYTVSGSGRNALAPGQTEFFEVSYLPQTQGEHSATVEVRSNAVNGTQTIQLGGEGTTIAPAGGNGSGGTTTPGDALLGRSGTSLSGTSPLQLVRVSPNPTPGQIDITYMLPASGTVECEVYSVDGRLLRTLHQGSMQGGTHELHADLRDLAEGVYFIMLRSNGKSAVSRINLAR